MKYFDHIINEFRAILKDQGVILFFFFLPIAYPMIYSWIYNNEVVREVPVVLVDDSHSSQSREFARTFHSSPDVEIAYHCKTIGEARDIIAAGDAYGILYFPSNFATKLGRMEQATVSVYCDMSYMLTYKAIFQTATAVSLKMGTDIQSRILNNPTSRDEEVSLHPLTFDEVPLFNTTGGYGNFILPAALVLIIQQALLMGVGLIAGTERERGYNYYRNITHRNPALHAISILMGKTTAYVLIFSVMLAWVTIVIPHIFGFISMVHGRDLLLFMTPYLLACCFLAITFSELVRYRENVMLVVVFTSIILLFMAGVSWPQSSIPGFWQGMSHLFPSTFGVRGFVRMSSMGALIGDVMAEYRALWIQTVVYALTALGVVCRRIFVAEK